MANDNDDLRHFRSTLSRLGLAFEG